MPRIEHIIAVLIVLWVITVFVRHNNRTEAQKEARKVRPSWATRTLAAATGAEVEAARLLPAVRELAGRGLMAAASKIRRTTSEKTADIKAKAAEAAEGRRERAAELGDKARHAAVKRGLAVAEAAQRRWSRRAQDRPLIDRRAGGDATAPAGREPAPGSRAAAGDSSPAAPQPVDEATITPKPASATTPGIAESPPRWRRMRRFVWWRRTPDPAAAAAGPKPTPDPATSDPGVSPADAATKPHLTVVPKEDPDMTATTDFPGRTRMAAPGATGPTLAATDAATVAQLAPADWAQVSERVRDNEPSADYELINLMTGEVAGICVYAAAYEQLHATCIDAIGLDPVAVQGLGEFTEHVMELAKAMSTAHQQFLVQYEEVLRAVANGVVLPYNGRWLTGEAAV
jgi:hypothetical protein